MSDLNPPPTPRAKKKPTVKEYHYALNNIWGLLHSGHDNMASVEEARQLLVRGYQQLDLLTTVTAIKMEDAAYRQQWIDEAVNVRPKER